MGKRTMDRSTKRYCKIVWDTLAAEYYSEAHKTSRNFDRIINYNLPKIVPKLRSGGSYLDLGGGRGRLQELYMNKDFDVIVGDFSVPMMKAKHNRFGIACRVQMDAFDIPFRSGTFDGVFSLVGDPYALREVFEEVFRVLKANGFFLLTLPTKIWRQNLIPALTIKENETIFRLRDGTQMNVPSFLYESNNLKKILLSCGFGDVEVGEWESFDLIERDDFSQHVMIAAKNLSVVPEELSLVAYAIAFKGLKCESFC